MGANATTPPVAKFLALVAAQLPGWTVRQSDSSPTRLIHPESSTIELPNNGSNYRDSFVQSKVRTLLRHTPDTPPPIDWHGVAKAAGMSKNHRRTVERLLVERWPTVSFDPPPPPPEEPMPASAARETDKVRVLHPVPADPPMPTVVAVEPYMSKAGREGEYRSTAADRRLWSDGTEDFPCRAPGCHNSSSSIVGASAHYKVHVRETRRNEAAGRPVPPRSHPPVQTTPSVDPGATQAPQIEPDGRSAIESIAKIVSLASSLDLTELIDEITSLERRLDVMTRRAEAAEARAEQLASNMTALRALIAEASDA